LPESARPHAILLALLAAFQAADTQPTLRWYKGNTHTHTIESDGDSTPEEVTRWYKEHGYNFLVLSDHNVLTSIDTLNEKYAVKEQFTLIRGEEVTDRFGPKSIHVNALDLHKLVPPQGGTSVLEVIQRNVDAIRGAGAIPHINHPNFNWSITAEELRQVRNTRLFEIFNGHPMVNNLGGGGTPGLEETWDTLLSAGVLLYGIAVDDAHHFKKPNEATAAGPGRGWVVVRAPRLEAKALLDAMERGDFYASTGVELIDYAVTDTAMTLTIKKDAYARYRVQFIAKGGRVVHEALDSPATYTFKGDEGYVRAKVIESNGRAAWTQPALVR
jgi:hypothetical protein